MDLYEELFFSLKKVHEQTIAIMQSKEDSVLPKGQMFLLFKINRSEKMKTTDISQFFGITPGAATSIADKLEQLEFIQRHRAEKDRRVVYITLTEKGKEFVNKKKEEFKNRFTELLGDFPKGEIQETIQSLNKIAMALQKKQ
ncbi:MarR family winged helix-turn-helix transcriptional regulator [Alkalihalobacillus deserti]|uniref:MarR family winged helix-turn-helix transcriptional regulator n=1 Tax=Alkalihalobacillus deserti TaxID=2879466 RepID=UPI001D150642|nr:MarR family transcriptional regulator [Alkalihalobacillus deserti]